MCGIVGYVGQRPAADILVEGLRRLEYRGYDSAGVALFDAQGIHACKTTNGVGALHAMLDRGGSHTYGIARTRWATHGPPTRENAHPHVDSTGRIAVVHNGIVENDRPLRQFLQQQGIAFTSDTDAGVYLHVGPEIEVASTKAFTGQVTVLALMACYLGRRKHVSPAAAAEFVTMMSKIPDQIRGVLRGADEARAVAEEFCDRENWLFLGRGYNYPVALEGALKLKEISYIHAEGLPAAEMKHGPLALITEGTPVVFIATSGVQYDKIISNISEVRSRGGRVIAIATEGNSEIRRLADRVLYVPDTTESLQLLLTVIPLQLIAYHAAVMRGCNVDKPRNLAKSVTVE